MIKPVELPGKNVSLYQEFMSEEIQEELHGLSRSLNGLRVVHINSTADGGGVAEILRSLVPLLQNLGLQVEWYVIDAPEEYFKVTKKLHNYLQGESGTLTREEESLYLRVSDALTEAMQGLSADAWMVHDPQPAAAAAALPDSAPRLWRCHIDTSQPNPGAMQFMQPFVMGYDAIIYSDPSYRFPLLAQPREYFIAPAIDPLAAKNVLAQPGEARDRLARLGVDVERPLVSQVARLDKWKDPIGVIGAYRLAKKECPALQLILLGVIEAQDDPEALDMYLMTQEAAAGDPDIHILVDGASIGPRDIAAVQAGSDVILQKSLREGFGLSVTEAMWQGRPVIAGDTPGLRLQIRDGETGFLVKDVPECAGAIVSLLSDKALSKRIAVDGHEQVRSRYLLPRLVKDELHAYLEMTQLPRGFAK